MDTDQAEAPITPPEPPNLGPVIEDELLEKARRREGQAVWGSAGWHMARWQRQQREGEIAAERLQRRLTTYHERTDDNDGL